MGDFSRPIEKAARNAAEYVDLQVNSIKYKTSDGISKASQGIVVTVLLIGLGTIFMTLVAFAFALLLGQKIGNYALGAFIVAGIFLLFILLVAACRKRLFKRFFQDMSQSIFFDHETPRPSELSIINKKMEFMRSVDEVKDFYNPRQLALHSFMSFARSASASLHDLAQMARSTGKPEKSAPETEPEAES